MEPISGPSSRDDIPSSGPVTRICETPICVTSSADDIPISGVTPVADVCVQEMVNIPSSSPVTEICSTPICATSSAVDIPISGVAPVTDDCVQEIENIRDGNLVGVIVNSLEEAFDLYNKHAYEVGFSVRKGKMGKRVDGSISWKLFYCSKAGEKRVSNKNPSYTRLNVRTKCPCLIRFCVDVKGSWCVTEHVTNHNHDLCPRQSSHLLRSHRKVSSTQLAYLQELKKSGVGVADGVRILKNQCGGSSFVGFSTRDAYNALNKSKVFDGTDANTLIQLFRSRQTNEKDFFFDFKVDSESRLCSFFWRDGRMREDYDLFGDLLVHDTIYETNKYDMICGPFVGINHHGKNVMFGCGLLMNEQAESFEWLFASFLRSMGGKHPTTIMTDQSDAMAAAILKIFPMSRHRLCIWHIGENSKIHIKSLRNKEGFIEMFNYLLKYVETEIEFQSYWEKMCAKYGCKDNTWMQRLYEIREKWCPAFSKDWFSGGILSSQRSESRNHAITRKLSKIDGLCDFYNMFVGVISEWRSKENVEDVRCRLGKPSITFGSPKLLLHAMDVYTVEIFTLFEDEFMKGTACNQSLVSADGLNMTYHVGLDATNLIKHVVTFNLGDFSVSCTCKLFFDVGILCCHCLRIMNIHCVSAIPERYIKTRWRKDVTRVLDDITVPDSSNKSMTGSSWRTKMSKKFQKLILACEENLEARLKCEEAFQNAKQSVLVDVGPILLDDCADPSLSGVIQNPSGSRAKGKQNKREKRTIEKKSNQLKGKRHRVQIAESQMRKVDEFLQDGIATVAGDGYAAHPSVPPTSASSDFIVVSPNTSSNLPPLQHSLSSSSLSSFN